MIFLAGKIEGRGKHLISNGMGYGFSWQENHFSGRKCVEAGSGGILLLVFGLEVDGFEAFLIIFVAKLCGEDAFPAGFVVEPFGFGTKGIGFA